MHFALLNQKRFESEGLGIPITKEMLQTAKSRNEMRIYPYMFDNTTHQDHNDAQFVYQRMNGICTTYEDLRVHRCGGQDHEDDGIDLGSNSEPYAAALTDTNTHLSPNTKKLHSRIQSSATKPRYGQSPEMRTDSRKEIVSTVDFVLNHPDVDKDDVE